MQPKRKLLTEEQYKVLSSLNGWKPTDIPREQWGAIPGLPRIHDTIALMGSADVFDPRLLNEIQAVAGFDQLVSEPNPKPGEPEGNAYHYVVQKISRTDHPYIMYGPFTQGMRVDHWFTASDLNDYLEEGNSEGKK